MTIYGDETIKCVRCGELFTWSYGEQRYYHEHGLHQPKHCPRCRDIRRGEVRGSEMDRPLFPVEEAQPQIPRVGEPVEAKRPSWWANPVNRYTVILWLLGFLTLVIFILLLTMIF